MSLQDVSTSVGEHAQSNFLNEMKVIKELSLVKKCMRQGSKELLKSGEVKDLVNKLFDSRKWYSAEVQEKLSCIVTDRLQQTGVTVDDLVVGTKKTKALFNPLKQLSTSDMSIQGVTAMTGFQGSEYFAVIKYPVSDSARKEENLIHEVAVGLVMNTLRQYTPNFMYVYGGFLCTPLVGASKLPAVAQIIRDENLYFPNLEKTFMFGSAGKSNPLIQQIYKEFESQTPIDSTQPVLLIGVRQVIENINNGYPMNYILDAIDSNEPVKDMHVAALSYSSLQNLWHLVRDAIYTLNLHEAKFDRQLRRYDRVNHFTTKTILDDLELIIKDIANVINNPSTPANIQRVHNELTKSHYEDFEADNLCKMNNDPSKVNVLMMTELVHNSDPSKKLRSLEGYLVYEVLTSDRVDSIILQLVFSLAFAHRMYTFVHNDLHINNILVHQLDPSKDKVLKLKLPYVQPSSGGVQFRKGLEIQTWVVPQIIDYGFASLSFQGTDLKDPSNYNHYKDYERVFPHGILNGGMINLPSGRPVHELMSSKMLGLLKSFAPASWNGYIFDELADYLYANW